jgi:AraC-like DNA-binding protein
MFRPSKLRTHLLQALEAGYHPDEILDGSGISWAEIESLQPLDLETIASLFDYVARRTPPGFGIRAGYTSKVRNYGIVGFATMSMPTLRDAFEHWSRYYLVSGDPIITTVTEQGDEWRMHFEPRCRMSVEAQRFCIETSVAALEPVIEELTDTPAGTLGIDFASDQPFWNRDYGVFRTRNIRFNQKLTTYHGKRRDLDRPIPSGDRVVSEMFLRQCDEFLADLTNTRSVCERLEDLMRASVGNIPSLNEMAVALGTSCRSLQRELRVEGIGYQQLVKRYRMRHAMLLLREKRPNVKAIAYMLGFKDVGSFRRAFRGWTGKSLGSWQRAVSSQSRHAPAQAEGRHLAGPRAC